MLEIERLEWFVMAEATKLRIKAELEKQIRQSKAEQELAIKDAERSLRLLERGRI